MEERWVVFLLVLSSHLDLLHSSSRFLFIQLCIYLYWFLLRFLSHPLAGTTVCLTNSLLLISSWFTTRDICNNHHRCVVCICVYLIRICDNLKLECYKPFIWWGGLYCRSPERTIPRSLSEFAFEIDASKLPPFFTSKQTRYYLIGPTL